MAASCSFSASMLPEPMSRRPDRSSFHGGPLGVKLVHLSYGMTKTWLTPIKNLGCRVSCCALQTHGLHSFLSKKKFQLDDVIAAQQFDRDILNYIFETGRDMEKNSPGIQILKGYLMATLFYELSFESAMKRPGGEVLTTENAKEFSSAAKGETLEDAIKTVEGYSHIIVISRADNRAAATAEIPVINAGDGRRQHPTQQMSKAICAPLSSNEMIKVALVGDLANGRTVRSLAYLLAKYKDVQIYFVSQDVVKMISRIFIPCVNHATFLDYR
ncbi:hypothetical protein SAY87_010296 [Trapa incisa]|uniref:Aspartate/ornithine carbamoyltransferase carbamoyl-P binding domain-containing protein n=1 Tax=Trapa incisa TaxID=236973 RepID=A0AAN7GTX0_9MYRT|nr:hypothetical protein SAY87_010296 [Trapa incisa]